MGEIEIKQRKNCNKCKALYYDKPNGKCLLGYKIKNESDYIIKPMEQCPKPLTNNDYIECNNSYNKFKGSY